MFPASSNPCWKGCISVRPPSATGCRVCGLRTREGGPLPACPPTLLGCPSILTGPPRRSPSPIRPLPLPPVPACGTPPSRTLCIGRSHTFHTTETFPKYRRAPFPHVGPQTCHFHLGSLRPAGAWLFMDTQHLSLQRRDRGHFQPQALFFWVKQADERKAPGPQGVETGIADSVMQRPLLLVRWQPAGGARASQQSRRLPGFLWTDSCGPHTPKVQLFLLVPSYEQSPWTY